MCEVWRPYFVTTHQRCLIIETNQNVLDEIWTRECFVVNTLLNIGKMFANRFEKVVSWSPLDFRGVHLPANHRFKIASCNRDWRRLDPPWVLFQLHNNCLLSIEPFKGGEAVKHNEESEQRQLKYDFRHQCHLTKLLLFLFPELGLWGVGCNTLEWILKDKTSFFSTSWVSSTIPLHLSVAASLHRTFMGHIISSNVTCQKRSNTFLKATYQCNFKCFCHK